MGFVDAELAARSFLQKYLVLAVLSISNRRQREIAFVYDGRDRNLIGGFGKGQ